WEKGSPLHKSTQQVRTQGPIRHADCRQRKLADFLCTGGIIQGLIRRISVASGSART
ncbi:MFS transporter, partial [Escherichia coli]